MNDRQDTLPPIADWDDAYDNRKRIPGAADFPPRWQAASADFRQQMKETGRARLGLRYGTAARPDL
jgi:arylformamidase